MIATQTTRQTIRAVLYLAGRYPDEVVPKTDICAAADLSPAFLTKILQPLIRRGLVSSRRGPKGGFALATPPEELTLLDVLEAVEEPFSLNVCLSDSTGCNRIVGCILHDMWAEAKSEFDKVFSGVSLRELIG